MGDWIDKGSRQSEDLSTARMHELSQDYGAPGTRRGGNISWPARQRFMRQNRESQSFLGSVGNAEIFMRQDLESF